AIRGSPSSLSNGCDARAYRRSSPSPPPAPLPPLRGWPYLGHAAAGPCPPAATRGRTAGALLAPLRRRSRPAAPRLAVPGTCSGWGHGSAGRTWLGWPYLAPTARTWDMQRLRDLRARLDWPYLGHAAAGRAAAAGTARLYLGDAAGAAGRTWDMQ